MKSTLFSLLLMLAVSSVSVPAQISLTPPESREIPQASGSVPPEVQKWWKAVIQAGETVVRLEDYGKSLYQEDPEFPPVVMEERHQLLINRVTRLRKMSRTEGERQFNDAKWKFRKLLEEGETRKFVAPIDDRNSPLMIFIEKPRYSEEGRVSKIMGDVRLRVLFQKNGQAKVLRIEQSLEKSLDESAINTVERAIFLPAVSGGRFCDVEKTLVLSFRIS